MECRKCPHINECRKMVKVRRHGPPLPCEDQPHKPRTYQPRPHGKLLQVLAEHGPATAQQLQELTGLSKGAVYSGLHRMHANGYAVPVDVVPEGKAGYSVQVWQVCT